MAIISSFAVSLLSGVVPQPAQAQTTERCFPETKQCISGRIRQYWEQNGGLPVFGFPIGPAQNERSRDTGQTYLTQWFERNRFELHPENKAPYDVLLGRLGDDMLRQRGIDWRQEPKTSAQTDCLFFAETGRNVCDQARGIGFKTYWQTHGLEFDGRPGTSYQESLALFGLPLTEPRMETNTSGDRVLTQWFERARFEWHPGQADPTYRVLLGLLGNELRAPTAPLNLPTTVPWIHTGNRVAAASNGAPSVNLAAVTQHGPPWQAVAAPNGKRLAFVENISSVARSVVVLDVETGVRRPYNIDTRGDVFGLVFSPDGQQLAYTVIYSGQQSYSEVRILDLATGTTAVRLTDKTSNVPAVQTWNASGLYARLVIYQSDAPVQGLVQIDPKTGSMQSVVTGNNYGAEISANGRYVALVTGDITIGSPPRTKLSVVDRTTGRETTIVPTGSYYIGNPQWSPDGTKIIYSRFFENARGAESVRMINADGTGEQALRLDTGAFPGRMIDFAWRSNTAVLMLTEDGPGKVTLFEVPLSNFHPAAAKTLQTFNKDGDFIDQIVYVPR